MLPKPLRIVALAILVGSACGGPTATDSTPTCDQVAQKLVRLAIEDNNAEEAPPDLDGVNAGFSKQCRDASWSTERRTCLLEANTQEDTLACPLQ